MQPLIADLSIDFDFFVREKRGWGWEHREGSEFEQEAWLGRYLSALFNVYDETDPVKWADFEPKRLIQNLTRKGIRLTDDPYMRARVLGVADSHVHAHRFFTEHAKKAPDMLINIDAHHDVYTLADKPLSCENWISHLSRTWKGLRSLWMGPKWQGHAQQYIRTDIETAGINIVPVRWDEWSGFKSRVIQVRNIFVCRSSAWTPPHHDPAFEGMVNDLSNVAGGGILVMEDIPQRVYPTYAEHVDLLGVKLKTFGVSEGVSD